MAESNKNLHVVVFPWLAFGHLIPFLELAKQIAQKGHKVSFVSTPRNIHRLPKCSPSLIDFVELSLPSTEGLPENAEATTDLPSDKVHYLKKAFDGLQAELTQFFEISGADWIVYDFSSHWLPQVACKLGISRAFFSTFNAWTGVFFGSSKTNGAQPRSKPEDFTVAPKWIPFPSKIAFRPHEIRKLFGLSQENASGVSDWERLQASVNGCDVFLVRSCNEFEISWINLLQGIHDKPIVPVGLLPPPAEEAGDRDDGAWSRIKNWLDMQEKESVVYVALGTEAAPSQEELTELAHGLEMSELPFFWVLREQKGMSGLDSFELPEGFEQRTKERGIVWRSWSPQVKILAHDSIGGFLTHCGWNSIIEGLEFGRPLVMFPFMGDQGLNARALEEKMVGVEIPRNESDGSATRNSVALSLKLVMADEKGKIYREEAKKMKTIFGDIGLQEEYIDTVIEYLKKH